MTSHLTATPTAALGVGAPAVSCRELSVRYGERRVLDEVSLDVAPDEVVALLGASGSGKTTLLYTLAGFITPVSGTIAIAGRVVAGPEQQVPPERRGIGMVFQNYALWPHLQVIDIVGYPARRAGRGRQAARAEAAELLERLHVGHLAARRPAELSGGEQQRVGLARALAGKPALYLFDEPTAHLDAALRALLRDEIAQRRRDAAAAAIYATHDAHEALAVADRVALLRDGRILQVGSPAAIYDEPPDLQAARLTGPASVLTVQIAGRTGTRVQVAVDGVVIDVEAGSSAGRRGVGEEATALVRPDWVHRDESQPPDGRSLAGTVRAVRYEGPHTDTTVSTDGGELLVRAAGPPRGRVGDRTWWRLDRIWLLPSG